MSIRSFLLAKARETVMPSYPKNIFLTIEKQGQNKKIATYPKSYNRTSGDKEMVRTQSFNHRKIYLNYDTKKKTGAKVRKFYVTRKLSVSYLMRCTKNSALIISLSGRYLKRQ